MIKFKEILQEKKTDFFHLKRFINAQKSVINTVLQELQNGHKASRWMWYIFPQPPFGKSEIAIYFGIKTPMEAKAYWNNELLRNRLLKCTNIVYESEHSILDIFAKQIDVDKFHSSITLFGEISKDQIFEKCLQKYFDGKKDLLTLQFLLQ